MWSWAPVRGAMPLYVEPGRYKWGWVPILCGAGSLSNEEKKTILNVKCCILAVKSP